MLALLTNLPSAYLAAQLKDGLVVMVLGMLVVFLFLIILIGAIKVMSKVLGKFAKPEEPKKKVAAERLLLPYTLHPLLHPWDLK